MQKIIDALLFLRDHNIEYDFGNSKEIEIAKDYYKLFDTASIEAGINNFNKFEKDKNHTKDNIKKSRKNNSLNNVNFIAPDQIISRPEKPISEIISKFEESMEKFSDLQSVNSYLAEFTDISAANYAENAVFGVGDENAKYIILLDNISKECEKNNNLLTDDLGKFLLSIFNIDNVKYPNIDKENFNNLYFTPFFPWRKLTNMHLKDYEISVGLIYLKKIISIIKPEKIFAFVKDTNFKDSLLDNFENIIICPKLSLVKASAKEKQSLNNQLAAYFKEFYL